MIIFELYFPTLQCKHVYDYFELYIIIAAKYTILVYLPLMVEWKIHNFRSENFQA